MAEAENQAHGHGEEAEQSGERVFSFIRRECIGNAREQEAEDGKGDYPWSHVDSAFAGNTNVPEIAESRGNFTNRTAG